MHALPSAILPRIPPELPVRRARTDWVTTAEARSSPRTSRQPAPPAGHRSSPHIPRPLSRAPRHRKVTREKATLHNLSPRGPGTCAGRRCSRGPLSWPRRCVAVRGAARPPTRRDGTQGTLRRPRRVAPNPGGDARGRGLPTLEFTSTSTSAAVAAGGAGDAELERD